MGQIRINFETETPYGLFCDALYFQEGEVPSEDELERLKQQRINSWIAVINTLSAEEVPQDG